MVPMPRRLRLFAPLAVLAAALAAAPSALATPPDQVARLLAQGGPCNANTGLAFDGKSLFVSCMDDSRIDVISPADGSLQRTFKVAAVTKLGALAYDTAHDALYGCSNMADVVQINRATGASTPLFKSANGCLDGLSYDGQDGTFWTSPDSSTPLTHQSAAGAVLDTHQVNNVLGGFGNSGVAAGWDALYLANASGGQVFAADKAVSKVSVFGSFPDRLSDIECDSDTFFPRTVVWAIATYSRWITAREILGRTCATGSKRPDLTAPGVSIVNDPPPNQFGWNNTPVNVVVSGADPAPSGPSEPVTGVQSVTYKLKGASTGEFTGRGSGVATVSASGTTTVTGTALDWSGNVSPEGTSTVKIETRQPTITYTGLEEDDRVDQGKPFSFRYQCDDRDSGVYSCVATLTGASGFRAATVRDTGGGTINVDTSQRGERQVTVIATDKAGNQSGFIRRFGIGPASTTAKSSSICGSRRKVRITLTKRKGRIVKVAAYRGKKKLASAKGRRIYVSLKGLPKKPVKIKVVGTTSRGKKVSSTRTYHPCQKKKGT